MYVVSLNESRKQVLVAYGFSLEDEALTYPLGNCGNLYYMPVYLNLFKINLLDVLIMEEHRDLFFLGGGCLELPSLVLYEQKSDYEYIINRGYVLGVRGDFGIHGDAISLRRVTIRCMEMMLGRRHFTKLANPTPQEQKEILRHIVVYKG